MKNKIIIGVVVLIILGAGAWYFVSQSNKGGTPVAGTPNAPAVSGNETSPDTLAVLLAAGKPVKCTVAPTADNGNISGTFYIANGKTRGDYSVTEGAQPMNGHMIVLGETSYTWFEGQSTGFKITAPPANTNTNVNSSATANQGFDPNQKIGYNCSPWSTDASVFSLPANVKFSDMSALGVPAVTPPAAGNVNSGAASGGNAAECAACDQVPAYRDQCRKALGCK
jgi:hypothetical protein